MSRLVMKFGGTSTGSTVALNRAADIVKFEAGRRGQIVVVVSAMQGVTDMLLACAEQALRGDQGQFQNTIHELHHRLSSNLGSRFAGKASLLELIEARMTELARICQHIQHKGTACPQERDEIAALGERINIHVFSAALQDRGLSSEPIDAADLIITDDRFQSASPIKTLTDERIKAHLTPLLAEATIPVVTGFIGSTISGKTTTLGRGGSDFTAAILAASLGADEIWIWTDVDGVMTADPALVSRARLIEDISYAEVFQLADSGAGILHPKTLLPAKDENIPIFVRNTFNPQCPGTKIGHCSSSNGRSISSITARFDIKTITFKMNAGENGQKTKSHLLAGLKKQGTDVWAIFHSEGYQSISIAISPEDEQITTQLIIDSGALKTSGRKLLQPQVTKNLSLITLVGRDIYLSPQVQLLVTNILDEAGIDIKQIGNGTSPDAIHFTVENQVAANAIQRIHDRIILNGYSTSKRPQSSLEQQPAI